MTDFNRLEFIVKALELVSEALDIIDELLDSTSREDKNSFMLLDQEYNYLDSTLDSLSNLEHVELTKLLKKSRQDRSHDPIEL